LFYLLFIPSLSPFPLLVSSCWLLLSLLLPCCLFTVLVSLVAFFFSSSCLLFPFYSASLSFSRSSYFFNFPSSFCALLFFLLHYIFYIPYYFPFLFFAFLSLLPLSRSSLILRLSSLSYACFLPVFSSLCCPFLHFLLFLLLFFLTASSYYTPCQIFPSCCSCFLPLPSLPYLVVCCLFVLLVVLLFYSCTSFFLRFIVSYFLILLLTSSVIHFIFCFSFCLF